MSKKRNDYEVGYGKPPKQHQFKPGRSGNPKGRTKRATTKAEIIARVRAERIPIIINGRRRLVDPFEAVFRAAIQQGLKLGRVADLLRLERMIEEKGFNWREQMREETERNAEEVVRKIMRIAENTWRDDDEDGPDEPLGVPA